MHSLRTSSQSPSSMHPLLLLALLLLVMRVVGLGT